MNWYELSYKYKLASLDATSVANLILNTISGLTDYRNYTDYSLPDKSIHIAALNKMATKIAEQLGINDYSEVMCLFDVAAVVLNKKRAAAILWPQEQILEEALYLIMQRDSSLKVQEDEWQVVYIYRQENENNYWALQQARQNKADNKERLLGEFLGYPESAIAAYENMMKSKKK